jgi:hypothetical protein
VVRTDVVEFEWLGHHVRVTSDSEALLDFVRKMWERGPVTGGGAPEIAYDVRIPTPDAALLTGPDGEVPLDPGDPVIHAYNLVMTGLHGVVGNHFLLHASCVIRGNRALLISGPSTYGKTTIALRLVDRGFRLVADDVTVINRDDGRPVGFDRPVNLRPGTRLTLTPEQLEAAVHGRRAVAGDEWVVDPSVWSGPVADDCRILLAVLMRAPVELASMRRFPFLEVRVVRGRRETLDELASFYGTESVLPSESDPWLVRVEVGDARAIAEWLRQRKTEIVWAVKMPAGPPVFDGPPEIHPMGQFQAGLELCQEMMNRHDGSALAREFAGRETDLVAEVAAVCRNAEIYALAPGRLEETVDLLVERFDEAVG